MKRKNYGIFLSAFCLGALLTACGDGAAPTESSAAEMTEETVGAVTETAAESETVSETTTETTSESLETTTVETTADETTTAETTTAETTTAAPETTVTEAETTEFKPYTPKQYNLEYPDIVPLYLRDFYLNDTEYLYGYFYYNDELITDYRHYQSWSIFDIDDPELLYLTENADFIRCTLLFGGKTIWSEKVQETKYDNYGQKTNNESFSYFMCPTYVNYPSFIDYAKSVFTDEYISKLENPDIIEENSFHIPLIADVDGQIYCSSEERGINPSHDRTIYRIHEQSNDKVTIERETIFCDMDHFEDDPDYYEPHSCCYIDLVKTPNGWRFDYFPMFDEYYNDINENGEWLYPEYHE